MTVIPDHRVTRDRNFDIVRGRIRSSRSSRHLSSANLAALGSRLMRASFTASGRGAGHGQGKLELYGQPTRCIAAGGAVTVMGQPPLEIDRAAGVERAVAAAQHLGEGGYRRTAATIGALLAEARSGEQAR